MTVVSVVPDERALTLTLTAEYAAPVERVWQLWADPRLLERWWGPPSHPATVTEHELVPGGRVAYYMTGPEGERYPGWWRVISIDEPHAIELEDGFGEAGETDDMPITGMTVTFTELADRGTRMVLVSAFPSAEAMKQLIEMGMQEGITEAMGQTDALLGLESPARA
jgi:uncharacterized protein YndB with AHSA1/START domain